MKKTFLLPVLITVLFLIPVIVNCRCPVVNAGPDSASCKSDVFTLTDATASDYGWLQWTSSGDGFFDDDGMQNPSYYPGPGDYANGSVELCLTGFPIEPVTVSVRDCMELHILLDPIPIEPSGTGAYDDPYLIAVLGNLYWMAVQTNAGNTFSGKFFLQTADIDAIETETWFNGLGWEPIGSDTHPFSGSYSGNNSNIKSLYINRENESYLGLFGYMDGAKIDKLRIIDADITGYYAVGSLAGWVINQTNISYIEVENVNIYISDNYAGGVIGKANYSNLFRCSSTGKVTKGGNYEANWIGGIVGAIAYFTMVEECYSLADIRSLTHNNYAGLIGIIWPGGQVKNCYSRGDAIGTWAISGGFTSSIDNGQIVNCFSTGRVVGVHYIGGFCGLTTNGFCNGNFWDIESSMQTTSECATGKTTAEMKTQSTFTDAGWDFENVWTIDGVTNDGYPFLKWQAAPTVFAGVDATVNCEESYALADASATNYSSLNWTTSGDGLFDDNSVLNPSYTPGRDDCINCEVQLCLTAYPADPYKTSFMDCMELTVMSEPPSAEPSGSGTIGEPYLVASLGNLYWIAEQTNNGNSFDGKFFLQTADINATGTGTWFCGLGWQPIGNINFPFSGSYNGGFYTIESLFINRENENYLGLFGMTDGARIENLRLLNVEISGNKYVGALAGTVANSPSVSYIHAENLQIHLFDNYGGGLLGMADHSAIYRCSSSGEITKGGIDDYNCMGGLIGAISNSAWVEECYSLTNLTSMLNNCYGGLVGSVLSGGEITNSYAKGSVTGEWAIAGGLAGDTDNGLIQNSFSSGFVSAPSLYVGGFLGRNESGTCKNSFWDTETSNQNTSACATGKTTAEMKTQSTFTDGGWDFVNIWDIDGVTNDGYPFLRWQAGPQSVSDNSGMGLLIYPNPGNGIFTIEGIHEKIDLRIFNVFGEQIYLDEFMLPSKLDLSNQPKGIYFISIETNNKIFFKKLVMN